MKKKLIFIFALCFTLSTIAHATENVVVTVETEEKIEVEESVEPEFSLVVETVTEVVEEPETEFEENETMTEEIATEIESDVSDDVTEEMSSAYIEDTTEFEVVEKITEPTTDETEIESTTEPVVEENSSEPEAEVESAPDSIQIGEVTEAETGEVSTEIPSDVTEEETEYVEAVVDDIVIVDEITDDSKRVFVQVTGENLLGKCANIKVRPINNYKDFYYIRTIMFDDDISNTVEILLSDDLIGLYRVDVDVEKVAHEMKVVVTGESSDNELTYTTERNTVIITGNIKTEEEKDISIKVLNESSNIVFVRSVKTAADGSYTVKATLPGDDKNYVVLVNVAGESGGYVKTVNFFNEETANKQYDFTCQSSAGTYEEVFVYAKNISGADKYVYEIDYSAHMQDVEISDLCVLTREKENSRGYCYNTEIEILNAGNGKIRFIVNSETPANKVWSGLLNTLKFERKTSNAVTFTLRVYE